MLFVLAGCAANMPLTANQDTLDLSNESIALVSVKVANQYKSSYQPGMMYAFFFPEGEDGEKTHIDIKTDPVVSEDYKYNEYILNFSLKPGTYNFAAIWGQYQVPLLLNATCVIPLNLKVEIKPNCVSYLGHIDAVIRKRNNDEEQRAGAVVPLLDQAVVGFSGGTFDVAISDQYGEDMGRFLAKYPALNNVTVEKNVLSQWVRPKLMSEAAE
jgi:stage V sporulation protein SpoVS